MHINFKIIINNYYVISRRRDRHHMPKMESKRSRKERLNYVLKPRNVKVIIRISRKGAIIHISAFCVISY